MWRRMLLPQLQALLLAWWLRECRKLFEPVRKRSKMQSLRRRNPRSLQRER